MYMYVCACMQERAEREREREIEREREREREINVNQLSLPAYCITYIIILLTETGRGERFNNYIMPTIVAVAPNGQVMNSNREWHACCNANMCIP